MTTTPSAAAAEAVLAHLEPTVGAWIKKDAEVSAIIAKHYAPLLSEVRAYLEQIQGNDPEQNRQEADVIANRALAAIDAAMEALSDHFDSARTMGYQYSEKKVRDTLELLADQIADIEAAKAQAVVEAGEKLITICKEIQSPAFMRYEEIRVDACLQRMSDAFASLADALRRWEGAT